MHINISQPYLLFVSLHQLLIHSLLLALLQMRRECSVGQCVSAQFQDSSARRCRRDLLLCFPPASSSSCLDCWLFEQWLGFMWRAFPSEAVSDESNQGDVSSPVCGLCHRTKPRLSGCYQPLPPPVVVFPSCHLSSLFSPSPEWIPLILSTLALEGGTLLAGPTPAPSISLICDSDPPLSLELSHPEYTALLHLRYTDMPKVFLSCGGRSDNSIRQN